MEPFAQRAQEMGLNINRAYKGLYSYEDQYGEVIYRQLFTLSEPGNPTEKENPTDNLEIPYLGIYVRPPGAADYTYAGFISNAYKFVGNDALCSPLRVSIQNTGTPIVRENTFFSEGYARFRNEIIIQSSVNAPVVGDVMPVMIIKNSYNGNKAASLSFGLATMDRTDYLTFGFRLGSMRMVHIESSQTTLSTAVTDYVQTFRENIAQLIGDSMNKRLTAEEMLATLDLVEGLGKKRRQIISESLPETVTAWGMFMAIVRYSSFEANLNVKSMLENIAQSVLVIPAQMMDVLERLESDSD
jgi:hypothetical protein